MLLNLHLGNRFATKLEYWGENSMFQKFYGVPFLKVSSSEFCHQGQMVCFKDGSFRNMTQCFSLLRFFFLFGFWETRSTPIFSLLSLWQMQKIMPRRAFTLSFIKRIYLHLIIYIVDTLPSLITKTIFSLMKNSMLYLQQRDQLCAL